MLLMLGPQVLRDEQFDRFAQYLLACVAEHSFGLGIDQRDVAAGIDDDHGVRGRFKQVAELLFGVLAFGDVVNEGIEADRVGGRGHPERQFDGKLPARPMPGAELEALIQGRSFAAFQELLQTRLIGAVPQRDDQFGQRPAENFLARPAKGLFRLGIPIGDRPDRIHGDIGIVGRLDDQADVFLVGPQSLFDLLPFVVFVMQASLLRARSAVRSCTRRSSFSRASRRSASERLRSATTAARVRPGHGGHPQKGLQLQVPAQDHSAIGGIGGRVPVDELHADQDQDGQHQRDRGYAPLSKDERHPDDERQADKSHGQTRLLRNQPIADQHQADERQAQGDPAAGLEQLPAAPF